MKSIHHFERIYIHREFVDMRKSINGLTQIVVSNLKLDIKANALFVFTNKRRTHLKILYFDKSGFDLTSILRTLFLTTLGVSFLVFINHKLVLN